MNVSMEIVKEVYGDLNDSKQETVLIYARRGREGRKGGKQRIDR